MQTNPVISVIVPVFNGTAHIQSCFEGIVQQGIERLELIFVDNNSTDDSLSQLEELKDKNSWVRVTSESKQGAASARNKGIESAQGDYIYFFDVDDILLPGALATLMRILNEHPELASVHGSMHKSYDEDLPTIHQNTESLSIKSPPQLGLEWMSSVVLIQGTPSFLHRRETIEALEGFREDLLIGEDSEMHIRLALQFTVGVTDRLIYVYRRHAQSTTSQYNRSISKAGQYWPRIAKGHLVYYHEQEVPDGFLPLLARQICLNIARQVIEQPRFSQRKKKLAELYRDIGDFDLPWYIRRYLNILCIVPYQGTYKFFAHFVVKRYLNALRKNGH